MAKNQKSQGVYQGHCECSLCGSSDAGAFYLHDDDSHSFSCFSCSGSIVDFDVENLVAVTSKRVITKEETERQMSWINDDLIAVRSMQRKIPEEVYDFFGIKMDLQKDGETIESVFYPTYREASNKMAYHAGFRKRGRFKDWHNEVKKKPELLNKLKCFHGGVGDIKKGIMMFGQWLWDDASKNRIILTCGEEDAVAAYHMTSLMTKFDGGYPTVSVPSGENVEGVKPHLRWLASFKEILIVADNDKQGRIFEKDLAKLLPVGKVRLVRLPKGVKDPSDMWAKAGSKRSRLAAAKTFYNSLFDAEKYSPAGIMSLSEGWGSYTTRGRDTLLRFPDSFGNMNDLTHGGYARGEIVNIIGPSSVGKTLITKEMIYETLMSTDYNIGVLALEETVDEFIEGLLSVHMSEQLNEVSYDERDYEREYKAFKELIHYYPEGCELDEEDRTERIHFLDHQGACDGEELLEKVDFLVNGLDCVMIILDPVTLACSGDTDEDEMASQILKRVKRHKLAWINVHHVRKNSNGGTANSEGADLAEEDIKGTGAWFQTGMINLIFTRNKVHSDPIIRNTMKIKMSKCRRHGKNTGIAGYIYYNGDNGRLELGEDLEKYAENLGGFDEEDDEPLNSF